MGADAKRSVAWVTLPELPERAACSEPCGLQHAVWEATPPPRQSGLSQCVCSGWGSVRSQAGGIGLRGPGVSCCLCPPGCWADRALMGEFGVWRPPLELSEQWETCQAWPRWPWRQSPLPRRPSAGASQAAQVQQPAQHRGPRPTGLQSGAQGPASLPGHGSLCFPAGQPCRGWSPP